MLDRIRDWARTIDWVPILAGTLFLVLVLWFLDQYPTDINKPQTYQDAIEDFFSLTSPEGWTAFATVVLAISTFGLWAVTNTAAKAAKEAAEALPIVERAHVYPMIVNPGAILERVRFAMTFPLTSTEDDECSSDTAELTFRIKNYGKTPAILKSVMVGFGIHPPGALIGKIVQECILGAGESTETLIAEMERGFTQREALEIIEWRSRVGFSGTIQFDDIWGNAHETEFFFLWVHTTQQMSLLGVRTERVNNPK